MSDERGPAALLEERPDLEPALESVLAVDRDHDTWTFDDIDLDSGTFGELVSEGVVDKDGGEYTVSDPTAVRAALGGEEVESAEDTGFELDVSLPDVETRTIGFVASALAVVVLTRAYVVGSVYRGGDIVLSGNDPYYYRYWVEQVAAESGGTVDFGSLSVLPETVTQGEPLMVATLWWLTELLGGTATSIGHVLAWYPVVSAVVTGLLVYLLAVRVTSDQRVGLASVLFLAIIPGHAFRTSLGFADHHAFDYPWLGLTALALLLIVPTARDTDSLQSVMPWAGSVLLSIGIAGQVLAWEAGPLLILPVAFVVLGKVLLDVETGRPPLVANAPILCGTGLAAVTVWTIHTSWGWHTDIVASSPGLLFVGVLGVVATAAVVARLGGTAKHLAAVSAAGAIGGLLVGPRLFPEFWADALSRTDALFRTDAIAETYGLFNPGTLGFLLLFGFALVLALPAMVWGIREAVDARADWLVVSVYGWYFLMLAAIQVRFVGELATFAALFAGYTFVWLASKVEVARPFTNEQEAYTSVVVPETRTLASLVVLFLLVGSFGLLQVPIKTSQVTINDATYGTISAIEDDAAEQELEYPENYVLTNWGDSRVYNYFLNGESSGYRYARNTYSEFLSGFNGTDWYDQLSGRVGYVVTENRTGFPAETMQSRLHGEYGSQSDTAAGLAHYRAVYASDSGSHKAFQIVPGTTITGTASPNATVTATTTVSIPNAEFEYARQTRADRNGSYQLVVANAGDYTVEAGNEATTVSVSEAAVRNGTTVAAG